MDEFMEPFEAFLTIVLDTVPSYELSSAVTKESVVSILRHTSEAYNQLGDLCDYAHNILESKNFKAFIEPFKEVYGREAESFVRGMIKYLEKQPRSISSHPLSASQMITAPIPLIAQTLTYQIPVLETAIQRAQQVLHAPPERDEYPQIEGLRVIRLLATGSHADIFLAEHPERPELRRVALKCIYKDKDLQDDLRAGYEAEITALTAMDSPHVITLHDQGVFEDHPRYTHWLEIEYCAYGSLNHQLSSPTKPKLRMMWIYQLIHAIQAIHKAGFVHRDLKPSNLLLNEEGTLKVSDFGVSKQLQPDSQGTLTHTGSMIGTVLYMSPEQLSGIRIDQRSDIWAIAAIIYELFVGESLVKGANMALVSSQILNAEFSLDRSEIPPEFQRVLARCLQSNPDHRYQNLDELWAELRPLVVPSLIADTAERQRKWWGEFNAHADSLAEFIQRSMPSAHKELGEQFLREASPSLFRSLIAPIQQLNMLVLDLCERHAQSTSSVALQTSISAELNDYIERQSQKVAHWNALFTPDGALNEIALSDGAASAKLQSVLDVGYELIPRKIQYSSVIEVKRGFFGGMFGKTDQEVISFEREHLTPHITYQVCGDFELSFCPPGRHKVTPAATPYSVVFPEGFWVMTTPVTEALWALVMGEESPATDRANVPKVNITWRETLEFANALSERDRLTPAYHLHDSGEVSLVPDASGYRLPTEAEWAYAATGGEAHPYAGGHELRDVGWSKLDVLTGPQQVAQKRPNQWGIYDMTGNVSEWCADAYVFSDERNAEHDLNHHPELFSSPSPTTKRSSRGGCWSSNARGCEIAKRQKRDPEARLSNVGFRLLISVPDSSTDSQA